MNRQKEKEEMDRKITGKLEEELKAYTQSGQIPFHMPGHKRRFQATSAIDSTLDFTEVEETDDLHHSNGILKEAMARTAALYGADQTWFLVNGSTCGNLAGIFALTHEGAEVIAARNCHRSVFHAIQLRHLKVHWLMPPYIKAYETYGSLTPQSVQDALEMYPDSEAVILTSPTYEGVISDIRAVSAIAHRHHVPVLVDEAHGPHLSMGDFPAGAVEEGADLVVQSPHKTLFSATQTAWLHVKGDLVNHAEVEKQLGIFETSSPSYPLMMSLDGCTAAWQKDGDTYVKAWRQEIHEFEAVIQNLRHIRVLEHQNGQDSPLIYAYDPGKILIHTPLSGSTCMKILHDHYHFTMEMAQGHNVLAMSSAADAPGTLKKLGEALCEMDQHMAEEKQEDALEEIVLPEVRMTIHDAVEMTHVTMDLENAAGRTAGEYLFLYPPGIPFIVPGEVIREEQIAIVHRVEALGYEVRHSESEKEQIIVCQK